MKRRVSAWPLENVAEMARIVVVLSDPPLPFGNAAARWFYVLLKGLTRRGHDVTTLAGYDDPDDMARVAEQFPPSTYDVRLFPRAPSRRSPSAKVSTLLQPYSYLYGPELREELDRQRARKFDVLHLEHLWGGWVGLGDRDRSVINIHYLFEIDFRDVLNRTLEDHARQAMTRRAERRLLRSYPTVTTLTPRLTERVQQISPGSTVHTVPLGMDLDLYPFVADRISTDGEPVLGLIGSFDWMPTYTAGVRLLTKLWPEIRRRVPGARLQVVGRKARSSLAAYLDTPGATFLEDVPEIEPYFRATDVMLYAPDRGSGMKVKVLEAFSFGVPVVTTADGVEGIEVIDGIHAGVCEDDQGLVERAVALLRDPKLRCQRRLAARALVEATCGPESVLDRLEAVYRTLPAVQDGRVASDHPSND